MRDLEFCDLLKDLRLRGVHVWFEESALRYRAPYGLRDGLDSRILRFEQELRSLYGSRQYDTECVVPLNSASGKNVLFCIHAIDGSALIYKSLADRLDGTVQTFAFQCRSLILKSAPMLTIEAMAKHYVQQMKLVQQDGPYCLFGFSSGGLIALEMAEILLESGEEVGLLALGDTAFSQDKATRNNPSPTGFDWVIFTQIFFSTKTQWLLLSKGKSDPFWSSRPDEQLVMLAELDGSLPSGSRFVEKLDELEVALTNFLRYMDAYKAHRLSPYPDEVTYFRVQGSPSFDNLSRSLAVAKLRLINVTGANHMQIVFPPGVESVAKSIKELLP